MKPMSQLSDLSYGGRVLRWVEEEGLFEFGETVYCFVQEKNQFRVRTHRLICGVNEVIFDNKSKYKFEIVQ